MRTGDFGAGRNLALPAVLELLPPIINNKIFNVYNIGHHMFLNC